MFTRTGTVQSYYDKVIQSLRQELEQAPFADFLGTDEEDFVAMHRQRYELPVLTIDADRGGGYEVAEPDPVARTGQVPTWTLYVNLRPHSLNGAALELLADGSWDPGGLANSRFDGQAQRIVIPVPSDQLERAHKAVQNNLSTLNRALAAHGARFPDQLRSLYKLRAAQIDTAQQKDDESRRAATEATARLGINLRRKADSVEPVNVRPTSKVEVLRTVLREARASSERRLSADEIRQIVALIDRAGQGFETAPSVYNKLSEPDLSTLIAGYLNAVFHADVATRETFVKVGKTDVRIQVGDRQDAALVVECKWWHGREAYLEALNQLLSYLTLRHTVGIVATFSNNQELSRVVDEARTGAAEHSSFMNGPELLSDTHFVTQHRHPDDSARELELHHLLFNLYDQPSVEAAPAFRRRRTRLADDDG